MKKKKQKNAPDKGEIIIYKSKAGEIELEVKMGKDTVWLTQAQIAALFSVERSVVTKHINNIFKDGELSEKSNVQKMHITNSDKPVNFYSLDTIISAGYRINSKRATQFRIWATSVLKKHLINGYTVNQRRFLENKENFEKLQKTIAFLEEKARAKMLKGQEAEILNILANYSRTFTLLEQYDKSRLKKFGGEKAKFILKYEDCGNIINQLKKDLISRREAGDIFGFERNGAFEGIVKNLYQTFSGKELYANLETKAAHILYLTIKDHPFSDGNKRIGSFIFVYFLDKNKYLYRKNGERKINDNALVALALLIAESNPKEKDQMIALITQLLK